MAEALWKPLSAHHRTLYIVLSLVPLQQYINVPVCKLLLLCYLPQLSLFVRINCSLEPCHSRLSVLNEGLRVFEGGGITKAKATQAFLGLCNCMMLCSFDWYKTCLVEWLKRVSVRICWEKAVLRSDQHEKRFQAQCKWMTEIWLNESSHNVLTGTWSCMRRY